MKVRLKKSSSRGEIDFGVDKDMLRVTAEIFHLLRFSPPEVGYNRRAFTTEQMEAIEKWQGTIPYPDNYREILYSRTGQTT